MTKEEVIQAIGKPDFDGREEARSQGKPIPTNFVYSYHNGLNVLTIGFKDEKVVKVLNVSPPPGSVPGH